MKKKLFVFTLLPIFGLIASFALSNAMPSPDKLLMENIEALADDPAVEKTVAPGELCWTSYTSDEYKSLRVCDTNTGKCYNKDHSTHPNGQGSMVSCYKK